MSRPVRARRQVDETVKPLLLEVFNANYRVYGLGDIPPAEFETLYYVRTRTQHQAPTPIRT